MTDGLPPGRVELRRFGFTVATGFLVVAAVAYYRTRLEPSQTVAVVASVASLLLAALAALAPVALGPVFRVWMALGRVLGWINTRVILGLVFYLLVTPIGVALRLTGRDPLNRRGRTLPTAWTPRVQPDAAIRYRRMY